MLIGLQTPHVPLTTVCVDLIMVVTVRFVVVVPSSDTTLDSVVVVEVLAGESYATIISEGW